MSIKSTDLGNLFGSSLIIFMGNMIGMGSFFLIRVILGNNLTTSEYGTAVVGMSFLSLTSIVVLFGIDQTVAQRISRDDVSTPDIVSNSFIIIVSSLIVSGCVIYILLPELVIIFGVSENNLKPFIISLPLYVILQFAIGVFRGSSNASTRVLVKNIIYQGGLLLTLSLLLFLDYNIDVLLYAWPLVLSVASITSLLFIINKFKERNVSIDRDKMKSLALFSLPLMLSSASGVVQGNIDNIFVSYFNTVGDVGIYDASFTISKVLTLVGTSAGFITLPLFSKYHGENDIEGLDKIYKISTKWISILTLYPLSVIIYFPNEILALAFGQNYAGGAVVLLIISSGITMSAFVGNCGMALTATEKPKYVFYTQIGALFVNILLNITLIPIYGIVGAAIATALSWGSSNLTQLSLLYIEHNINPFYRKMSVPLFYFLVIYLLYQATLIFLHIELLSKYTMFTVSILGLIAITLLYSVEDVEKSILMSLFNRIF